MTHVNLHMGAEQDGSGFVSLRITPEATQLHMQRIIEGLALAVEHFRSRCEKLEDEARRARAEGRREALRELGEKLREAEWRVMQAQAKKKEAEEERERLEGIMARARYKSAAAVRRPTRGASPVDDQQVFESVLTSADVELDAIRAELRTLADDLRGGEKRTDASPVVRGETVPTSSVSAAETGAVTVKSGGAPLPGAARPQSEGIARASQGANRRKVVLRRRRRYLGRTFFVAAVLPMPLAGMAIRVTFSHEPGVAVVWSVLFPVSAVLIATVTVALLLLFARLAYAWGQDEGAHSLACAVHTVLGVVTFIVGVALTPDALPPVLAHCGVLFAEYLGPL